MAKGKSSYYSGRVVRVIFGSPEKAFYIMRLKLDDESTLMGGLVESSASKWLTVKGNVPLTVEEGMWLGFEARWVTHPKYGDQLEITRCPVIKEWDAETSFNILKANGIGEGILEILREEIGDEKFTETLGDLEALKKVKGTSERLAKHIYERWISVRAYFKSLDFLAEAGIPQSKIDQVWGYFGDTCEEVLSHDPWSLVQLDGIKFSTTDEVARRLGLSLDDPKRLKALALYTCKTQKNNGHLYVDAKQIIGKIKLEDNSISGRDVARILKEAAKDEFVVLDNKTREGTFAVYEPWAYELESESARILNERKQKAHLTGEAAEKYLEQLKAFGPDTEKAVEEGDVGKAVRAAVDEWGNLSKFKLSERQAEGVINALTEPVSVLTGLPGTGKSSSLKAAVAILKDIGVKFLMLAPTGIAAKRLSSVTNAKASTIHRAFGAKGSHDEEGSSYVGVNKTSSKRSGFESSALEEEWEFNADNPHPAEVILVDESSMVDQHLLYRILTCTQENSRLVFVGDAAQLPSVGPGNVLRSLVQCGQFPVVSLEEIFRQEDTSDIVFASHEIHKGEMPENLSPRSDFSLIERSSEDQVMEAVTQIAMKLFKKKREFQVISPRHKGAVGVTNFNNRLRKLINPAQAGAQEVRMGGDVMREGDRVMITKNDYELGVFNGDVGKIDRIDRAGRVIYVKIHGVPPVVVPVEYKKASRMLRLAYCTTVHRCQGQEFDYIVMPIVDGFRHQLQRNLLYTAVTRARKRVVLVGTRSALAKAVFNDREDIRNSLFVDRLQA